jgi:hypothetical protein
MFQYLILLKTELEFYIPYFQCHQLCAWQMESVLHVSYPYYMVRAAEMTVCWVTTLCRVTGRFTLSMLRPCHARAVPMPCRAPKGLERDFPI